jgi:hypothetical protein
MQEQKTVLRLIKGGASTAPVTSMNGYDTVRLILRRVLKARLKPGLTVEEACHLRVYSREEPIARMEHLLEDVQELRRAGLEARMQLDDIPEGIVLTDPKAFIARFPDLAATVPVMLAHDGVQPYTDGLPRRSTRLSVV